jgi:hypothetical protein
MMRTITVAAALAVLGAVAAWPADVAFDGGPAAFSVPEAAGSDGTLELKWDNGTRRWSMAWYTGAGSWVGNDFNLSTISTYRAIEKVRFYSRSNWPNTGWDGFRVAIYDFKGAVPGSRLWPTASGGYFFKPSGLQGHIWVDIAIGWTCTSTAFVAAVEQFYNYPYCDPFALDTNPTFRGHSWRYYQGSWSPYESSSVGPYRNVMIRAVVNNITLGVAPQSLGRVKALYY